jgi:hypothetical protein
MISAEVKTKVSARFPENNTDYKAVGAFFFLRFLCPAVMTPQVYGLLPAQPGETSQRYFVLISKTLQNLANETLPGVKEEYMAKMNEFVTDNVPVLHKFIDHLAFDDEETIDDEVRAQQDPPVPDDLYKSCLAYVHDYMVEKSDELNKQLEDDEVLQEKVEKLLHKLGAPCKQPNKKKDKSRKKR